MKENTYEMNPTFLSRATASHLALIPDLGHYDQHTHSITWGRKQTMEPEAITILVKISTQALRILSGVAGLSSLNGSVRPESFLAE